MNKLKVQIVDLISQCFTLKDHVLVPSVPIERWREFVQSIEPVENGHSLIRVGPTSEGSYLLPDDLVGIGINISPGVGETYQFEKALLKEFGIPSLMLDASVGEPNDLPEEIKFVSQFLIPAQNPNFGISISELVSQETSKFGPNVDFMLQMDIEGAEYDCLLWANLEDLLRFRILAIEFHDMELWVQNTFFSKTVSPIFSELLKHFDVVHSRANNHAHTFRYKGYFIPSALELTFHRKDRSLGYYGLRNLPSSLDVVNNLFTSQETPFNHK